MKTGPQLKTPAGSSSSSMAHPTRGNFEALPFPAKLHIMLREAEEKSFQEIISWNRDGRSFQIFDNDAFTDRILPVYFKKQTKFKSFQRQLNIYSFRKEPLGVTRGSYFHPCFLRGNVDLCNQIIRQKKGSKDFKDPRIVQKQQQQQQHEAIYFVEQSQPAPLSSFDDGTPEKDALYNKGAEPAPRSLYSERMDDSSFHTPEGDPVCWLLDDLLEDDAEISRLLDDDAVAGRKEAFTSSRPEHSTRQVGAWDSLQLPDSSQDPLVSPTHHHSPSLDPPTNISHGLSPSRTDSMINDPSAAYPGDCDLQNKQYCSNGPIQLPEDEQTFPWKLHRLLDDAEKEGFEHVVSWTSDGKSFKIHDTNAFLEDVSGKYFDIAKYESFRRQLNLYSFHRISRGPSRGTYSHPYFRRGRRDLCHQIERQVASDSRK